MKNDIDIFIIIEFQFFFIPYWKNNMESFPILLFKFHFWAMH